MASAKAYLEKHKVEEAITDAIAQVVNERPDDALTRIGELLKRKAGPKKLLDTVGNTPLVEIDAMLPKAAKVQKTRVLCKMEMQNPGGSIKDRISLRMIEEAEASGRLKKGMSIVEATSGNTGIGLAMVAAAKGYKCIIIMPQVPPMTERYLACRHFGAQVVLTAAGLGVKGMLDLVESYKKKPKEFFCTEQFDNSNNPNAHELTTAPEVWDQSMGQVDAFIHGIGTGGCIAGTGKFLKSKKPECKVIAVEPSNGRVHVGDKFNPHPIVGIGAGITSHFLQGPFDSDAARGVVDEWAHASGDECVEYARKAAMLEGIACGPSAGAALKVACDVAARPEMAGKTVVVVLASHAIRYATHPLWSSLKTEAALALPSPPNTNKDIELVQWTSPTNE